MPKGFVDLNDEDAKRTVLAVLDAYLKKESVGSLTEQAVANLYNRLHYEKYCIEHEIPYESMTEDDYINAYEESLPEVDESEYDF